MIVSEGRRVALTSKRRAKLKRIIKRAHDTGCPIRFWNTPDAWKKLAKLGIDIINTDKITECAGVMK